MAEENTSEPEEIILEMEVIKGTGVLYTALFFEWHIKETLKAFRFSSRGLSLGERKLEIKNKKHRLIRTSKEDKDGTFCRYIRLPKEEIYDTEDWNDYEKVIEQFEFVNGHNCVRLQKYDYFVTLDYAINGNKAYEAARKGFEEFKGLAVRVDPSVKDLSPDDNIEPFGSQKLRVKFRPGEFDSKKEKDKEKFPLKYEFILQDEIMHYLLQK